MIKDYISADERIGDKSKLQAILDGDNEIINLMLVVLMLWLAFFVIYVY